MEHNIKHLNEETKNILTHSIEEKISYLHEEYSIEYPKFREIINLLNNYLQRPKKSRMNSLLIVGEPNIGKTSIINKFMEQNPPYESVDEQGMPIPVRPVIKALAPSKVDIKSLYISLLEGFWTPHNPNDTADKLKHQFYSLMSECHVSMIVIDEFHHLAGGTSAQQINTLNTLKNISTAFMIPIVVVGIKDAIPLLMVDPQLSSRFDIVRLPKWNLDQQYRGLLKAFEKRLPLPKPSYLYNKEKATLLYTISQGNTGDLQRLLIECAQYAINNKLDCISEDIIKKFKWVIPTNSLTPREIIL
ncbi:MAG: TniB family NTP-binding protein [Arcobacteraceae bacterium]